MQSKPRVHPSYTDLLKTDTQRAEWKRFDQWLWEELVAREPHWSEAQWGAFEAAADAGFPVGLIGVVSRARRIHKEKKDLGLRMVLRDILTESCASLYVARKIGALELMAPLAHFASMASRMSPTHPGDVAMLRYTLSAGADPNIQGERGVAALHTVAQRPFPPRGHPAAIRVLLAAGADPSIRTEDGDTPLHFLCGFYELTESVAEGIRALLASGASMEAAAADGETPLKVLKLGRPDGQPESEESKKCRRELLGDFESKDLDELLPMGAPSARSDIDGRRV